MTSQMTTQPPYAWSHLKAHLTALEKGELLRLLHDLWDLNVENRRYLSVRFLAASPAAMAAPYREIIRQTFNPAHGPPTLDVQAARRALTEFGNICPDSGAVIDLMLFYVEEGVTCAVQYGDIGESAYNSFYRVFRDALTALNTLDDPAMADTLRPRFREVINRAAGCGWGLYEDLAALYVE